MNLYDPSLETRSFIDIWLGDPTILNEIAKENPNLASHLKGYGAEYIWRDQIAHLVESCTKQHDKDLDACGDWKLRYRGTDILAEVKCLTSPREKDGVLIGNVDIGHRDKSTKHFPDGTEIHSRHVYAGEFDLLAVDMWWLFGEHKFAYCLLDELPAANLNAKKHTYDVVRAQERSGYLKQTNLKVSYPLGSVWTENLTSLLDLIALGRMVA